MRSNEQARLRSGETRLGLYGFDAYRVALSFYRELRTATRGRRGHVVEQGNKAAESVVLNVAEAHPTTGADRARRFRIAVDEAYECGAALDLLEVRGDVSRVERTKPGALRVVDTASHPSNAPILVRWQGWIRRLPRRTHQTWCVEGGGYGVPPVERTTPRARSVEMMGTSGQVGR